MVEMMGKKKPGEVPSPRDDDGEITTFKMYRRLARVLVQLATLRDLKHPDLIQQYAKLFEDDLYSEMAKRQAELRGDRKA